MLLIPTEPLVREEPVAEEAQIPGRALFPQMRKSEDAALQGEEDEQGLELINIAVLLPFNTGGAPDDKSIDFYSGALLAARELGNKGININLSTYDISGGNISSSMLRDADLILGPISEREVYSAANICPYSKYKSLRPSPKLPG